MSIHSRQLRIGFASGVGLLAASLALFGMDVVPTGAAPAVAATLAAASAVDADFDSDGRVGFADFLLFARAFGSTDVRYDLDGDGRVRFGDFLVFVGFFGQHATQEPSSPYAAWENGPPTDEDFFPIGVWLQSPSNATRYQEIGVNFYVGLWQGPTEAQLSALKAVGMPVICSQNTVGLLHVDDDIIWAWMHNDEPDNAQPLPTGGYGPPITPEAIQTDYAAWTQRDPTRPVFLNLGQGVAYDGYVGRGTRTNHPEDYANYARGTDLVSFDIYPVTSDRPMVKGKLQYVAQGVERLTEWAPGKPVWNVIECTYISATVKPTPAQVRSEVWMSLIHGSTGIIYFCHQFEPTFNEWALLDDAEMREAVKAINARIRNLAGVLNSPSVEGPEEVSTSSPLIPIATMMKRSGGTIYLFAVSMNAGTTVGTFRVAGVDAGAQVTVLDEGRTVPVDAGGGFSDTFPSYTTHLYEISEKQLSAVSGQSSAGP